MQACQLSSRGVVKEHCLDTCVTGVSMRICLLNAAAAEHCTKALQLWSQCPSCTKCMGAVRMVSWLHRHS